MNGSWNFPSNNYATETGLNTGDVETFMKEPEASLAREIAQNSIDAKIGNKAVVLEFERFFINRDKIPDIDELTEQISRCYEYKKDSPKEAEQLKKMLNYIKQDQISCLRISDHFTKGLEGVSTNDSNKPFYLLTKGSGVSLKEGTTGGSKGIGKYAAFVNSKVNTVFYSTYSYLEEKGYIGVSKLCSAPIPKSDDEKTQGIGYYADGKKNLPVKIDFSLQDDYKRNDKDYGTDVYIIGFEGDNNWEWLIASKILESFMVAIKKGSLVVNINGIIDIKECNMSNIMSTPQLKEACGKRIFKDINAQYAVLYENEINHKTVYISDYGQVDIYVKKYNSEHSAYATQKCALVRYPYMKIKNTQNLSKLPFSALCVIDDNELNLMLRKVENPQHTDWEFNRLNDDKQLKKKTREAKKLLEEEIKAFVKEVLMEGQGDETDFYGAGEFLPADNEGVSIGDVKEVKVEIHKPSKPKRNKPAPPKFDKGTPTDDGDDAKKPGTGGSGGGNNHFGDPTGNGGHGSQAGDNPVLKKVLLSGIKYKNIIANKKQGIYDIVFVSPYTENNCDLEVMMCGEASDKYHVPIQDVTINGKVGVVKNGKLVDFQIRKGVKYKIQYRTGEIGVFSSEVIMNAYR